MTSSFKVQWDHWDEDSQRLIQSLDGRIGRQYFVSCDAETGKYRLIKMDASSEFNPIGIALNDAQKGENLYVTIVATQFTATVNMNNLPLYWKTSPFADYINDELDIDLDEDQS